MPLAQMNTSMRDRHLGWAFLVILGGLPLAGCATRAGGTLGNDYFFFSAPLC
jgi:hypothetical protein